MKSKQVRYLWKLPRDYTLNVYWPFSPEWWPHSHRNSGRFRSGMVAVFPPERWLFWAGIRISSLKLLLGANFKKINDIIIEPQLKVYILRFHTFVRNDIELAGLSETCSPARVSRTHVRDLVFLS